MARALRRFGYRLLEAGDGDSAMAALETAEEPVDLAILDVVMPGGGAELVRRIREKHPDVPLLVATGYGPGGEVQRMLEAGAYGVLQKPFDVSQLRDAVQAALS
jgi:CheY-like chemotaxis protein